jgi:hypothetical protein
VQEGTLGPRSHAKTNVSSGYLRIVLVVQFGVSIEHHDHGYIERRGGHAFFSHLRGAPGRARYREEALRRAEAMHGDAVADGAPAERVCGAGLIVLQRAALAAEDLASLLHAVADEDPAAALATTSDAGKAVWERLTSVKIPDQRKVFLDIAHGPSVGLRAFRLPTDDVLAEEGFAADAMDAGRRLRDLTAARWMSMLHRVAVFWLRYGDIAKSTMHGFAAIAGREVTEPPGAGILGEGIVAPDAPFVVMVNSTVAGTVVQTPHTLLPLSVGNVSGFRRCGSLAVRLTRELCETLAEGIDTGYAYGIPPTLSRRLSPSELQALEAALQRQSEEPAPPAEGSV